MSDELQHAAPSPAPDQLAEPAAPAVAGLPGAVLPPFAVLSRASLGSRAAWMNAAQRGAGNAAVAREVLARAPRPKWAPKPEGEWTAGERAHVATERAKQDAEAGAIKGRYEKLANDRIAKAALSFSALELGKEHVKVDAVSQTPITREQVSAALAGAWQSVFGTPIPPGALRILVGKWIAEGGEKGTYGYNLGNMQPSKDTKSEPPIADYAQRRAPENTKAGGTEQRSSPFYVFKSLEQGAMALIYYVVGLPRNRAMMGALMFGGASNPRDYVYAMKGCGYMTATVETIKSPEDGSVLQVGYLNNVQSGMNRFSPAEAQQAIDAVPPGAAADDEPPDGPPVPLPDPPPEPSPEPSPPSDGGGGEGGAGGGSSREDREGGAEGAGPV